MQKNENNQKNNNTTKNEEIEETYWADEVIEEITKRNKKEYLCEGMWSPSGYFHIGNARPEIFTVYVIKRVLEEKGYKAKQNLIVDDFDGIRKIPVGLNIKKEEEKEYLGIPYKLAKSPIEGYENWADYFIKDVTEEVNKFGVELNIISAYETYKEGKFNEIIKESIQKSEEIAKVWKNIAGADKNENFVPIQMVCEKCKNILATEIQEVKENGDTIKYHCKKCGYEGENNPYNGNAKLHWRVHWVAHWILYGVDFESGGKDHFSKGGSVDVSQAIIKEIFKKEGPIQRPTEFLQVKGKKLSGSLGGGVNLKGWQKVATPELFRYLNFLYKPKTVIELSFDDNSFILLNARFERTERIYFGKEEAENKKVEKRMKRLYEQSKIKLPEKMPIQVPFNFAIYLVQLINPETEQEKLIETLKNTGHIDRELTKEETNELIEKMKKAKNYVEMYMNEESKIKMTTETTEEMKTQANEIKEILKKIIEKIDTAKNEEEIQTMIFETAKEENEKPKKVFQTIYQILIGKNNGPKVGTLIIAFGKNKVKERLEEIVK